MDKKSILLDGGINYDTALHRFSNNEDMYLKFLMRFEEEKLYDSAEEYFNKEDYPSAATAVHTLKGVAANLSIDELASVCENFMCKYRENDTKGMADSFVKVSDKYRKACEAIHKFSAFAE